MKDELTDIAREMKSDLNKMAKIRRQKLMKHFSKVTEDWLKRWPHERC